MHGLLDRDAILALLDELDKELRFSRTRAQVYVVGGAAISMAFSRERRTMDVDARIDKGHYELTRAVQEIGRRHGLGDTWLKRPGHHHGDSPAGRHCRNHPVTCHRT